MLLISDLGYIASVKTTGPPTIYHPNKPLYVFYYYTLYKFNAHVICNDYTEISGLHLSAVRAVKTKVLTNCSIGLQF